MDTRKIIYIVALLLTGTAACKKESSSIAYANTPEFAFPQGNEAHDKELTNWYNRYKSYFIYRFTNEEYNRYTQEAQLGRVFKEVALPGDPQRMGAFVQLLQEEWLRFYPDSVLVNFLPYKVFMAASISDTAKKTNIAFGSRYKSIAITGASAQLDTLSAAGRRTFRVVLNQQFLFWVNGQSKLVLPPAFYAQSNYSVTLTDVNRAAEGFLKTHTVKDATRRTEDLAEFLALSFLRSPEWLNDNLFTLQADPNGKLKAKYNILADHFKTRYNIDLRAAGQ